ncbi:hypothetical protein SAFG77S_01080 [Streptomyces afghaniensis]
MVWAGGRSADQRSPGIVAPRGGATGCPVEDGPRLWAKGGAGEPYPDAEPGRRFWPVSWGDGRLRSGVEGGHASGPTGTEAGEAPPGNLGPNPSTRAAGRGRAFWTPDRGAPAPGRPGPDPRGGGGPPGAWRSSAAEGGVGCCMGRLPLRSVRLDRVRRRCRKAPTGQGRYGVTARPGVPPLR